jgi:hypothetical protein
MVPWMLGDENRPGVLEERATAVEAAQRDASGADAYPAEGVAGESAPGLEEVRPVARWTTPTARVLGETRSPMNPVASESSPVRVGRQWVTPSLTEGARAAWQGAEPPPGWETDDRWSQSEARALSTDERFAGSRETTLFKEKFKGESVRRYEDAPVARLDLLQGVREEVLSQLSLADVNRYQFRRNRSNAPGLPASPAGGGQSREVTTE